MKYVSPYICSWLQRRKSVFLSGQSDVTVQILQRDIYLMQDNSLWTLELSCCSRITPFRLIFFYTNLKKNLFQVCLVVVSPHDQRRALWTSLHCPGGRCRSTVLPNVARSCHLFPPTQVSLCPQKRRICIVPQGSVLKTVGRYITLFSLTRISSDFPQLIQCRCGLNWD